MDAQERFWSTIATTVIWGAVCLMVMSMSNNAQFAPNLIWVMLVGLIAAGSATTAIWRGGTSRRGEIAERIAEKAKHTRVQKLLNTLSDTELDELRARLSNNDGELSLEDLLSEQRRMRK